MDVSVAEIASYYDGFGARLLEDYRVKNARVVAAIDFAKEHVAGASVLLDVGCGIGWTSSEFAALGIEVLGVDVSPALIRVARKTFPDVAFTTSDITALPITCEFDAITIIDCYEHIPLDRRLALHERLARLLRGVLVLTVPTPEALQYARDHDVPLQIVDEDVTDEDIDRLAYAVGGEVVVNKRVSIWRDNDYRHAVIRNG